MVKKELVRELSEKTGFSQKDCENFLISFQDVVKETVFEKREDIKLSGFGNFSLRQTDAREGRIPSTGETTMFPASENLKFKASGSLKRTK